MTDNESPINNIEAGKRFAKTARVILTEEMTAANSTHWFTLENMLDVAEAFGIYGIFNSDDDHWRLVLGINRDGTLRVYDPLYNQDGSHIYDYSPSAQSVSMPSRHLQKHYGIDGGAELFKSEPERLDLLIQKDYTLNLPRNFRHIGLQEDERNCEESLRNCGPLVLYAAIVGDKHTSEFKDKPDFAKLKQTSGIDVV